MHEFLADCTFSNAASQPTGPVRPVIGHANGMLLLLGGSVRFICSATAAWDLGSGNSVVCR